MGEKRGRTKKNSTNELQELDPKGSSHLEEEWIGGNVYLNLLSLFPLIGGKNHGGIEGKQSSRKVNNGGNTSCARYLTLGKKGAFYRPPRKRAVAAHLPQSLRPRGAGVSGLGAEICKSPARIRFDSGLGICEFHQKYRGKGPESSAWRCRSLRS